MLRMCIAVSGDEKNGTLKECSKEGILWEEGVCKHAWWNHPSRIGKTIIPWCTKVSINDICGTVSYMVVHDIGPKQSLNHSQRAYAAPVLHGEVEWRHIDLLHYLPLWTKHFFLWWVSQFGRETTVVQTFSQGPSGYSRWHWL
jgi:hypothetical protein